MTSSRQNKNRNSRRTNTATSTKRNFTGSMLLATSVNTASTASATPVQEASNVDQSSDLPTLPNKNASLEQQLKQQQLLIDQLTTPISALESHVQLFKGKIVIQEMVSNLLQQKANNLGAYSRGPCTILSEIQKSKKESWENIKTSVFENLIKEESSDDSPNEEGIVKFAFADVHGTLKIVLTKFIFNPCINLQLIYPCAHFYFILINSFICFLYLQ